jgi:hypothetical protein
MKSIMDVERQPKPAFFAYREALTPLMANIRTDRTAFTAGEGMRFEFWVCNDTHEVSAGAQLRYQLEMGGKVVFAQQAKARVEDCRSTFQGFLRLPAPVVKSRTAAVLRLALALPGGKIIHDTSVALDLFPSLPAVAQRVVIVGSAKGKAAQLAHEIDLKPSFALNLPPATFHPQPLVILIDDFALFEARRAEIEAAVKNGATAIFMELPAGEHAIGGDTIKVEACGMGARHFVSRDMGHPLVAGFGPEDFRLWYDPAADYINPLLETCFRAEGWTPILTTGSGGGTLPSPTAWSPALAAAEKQDGAGHWRICQVMLAGRVAANPVAGTFASRLLNTDLP